jgi:glycosyltransferase involved in cell wall biosynthesis
VEEPVFGPFISSSVPKVVTTHVTQLGEVGALLEVFNSSGQISRLVFSGTIGWAFDRLCLRDADVVVAVGPVIRTELCRYYGVREEIVRVIPNGVDVPRKVNKVEAKREIGVDNILFLYVGRLVDRKRVGDFLAALHMVRQRGLEDFSALIVGSGPVGHALTRLTSGLRLGDRVTFTGHVDDRMLFHLFEAADVFVLPSCYEGNPISVMEAMAYGCVPVVSDIPHLREIVRTHENGLTYPVGDVESLADALLTLATDDELRASISLAARRSALHFSWSGVASKYVRIYHALKHGDRTF